MSVQREILKFKRRYPLTVAFRIEKHAKVIDTHLGEKEKINYVFCGQKNVESLAFFNSCVVALTNKRIVIAQKRLLWGYFFTSITPDMYNDLKVIKNLIWSDIEIDTIKENVYISNLDPEAAIEIESKVTEFMIKEKKKYGKKNN